MFVEMLIVTHLANTFIANIAAQWLKFLLRIREVLGPNLDPEIEYTDGRICGLSSGHVDL
jgi:hypothetical protein